MTEEQIIEMAQQAGFWKPLGLPSDWCGDDYVVTPLELRDFIKLVQNETIEWVAQLCDDCCKEQIRSLT